MISRRDLFKWTVAAWAWASGIKATPAATVIAEPPEEPTLGLVEQTNLVRGRITEVRKGSAGNPDYASCDGLRTSLRFDGPKGVSLAVGQLVLLKRPGWEDEFACFDGGPEAAAEIARSRLAVKESQSKEVLEAEAAKETAQ